MSHVGYLNNPTPRKPKPTKGWRSGWCNHATPPPHPRCLGHHNQTPCVCECHAETGDTMTLHILKELEQGTPEWHDARRGIITASAVGKLLTPTLKVADNETARGLTATLAAERIAGWTEDTPMTSDMWRGVESEPHARDVYDDVFGKVTQVGFMRLEEAGWTLGYSPDGLVGDDGLIEIKAPRAKTHVKTILADEVPAYYMPQLQAGLLVSGRAWIDFVSYVGGLPLYVKRVVPDPRWFDAITAACVAFETNVTQIVADYTTRVAGLPTTDRIDYEIKVA